MNRVSNGGADEATARLVNRSARKPDQIPMANPAALLSATAPVWRRYLKELFDSGQFILGSQTASFEREYAAYIGAQHVIGVGCGTDAVEVGLRCAGISNRDQEVVTSALTSPYTALAILAAGATPRFADVDPHTLLLDPAAAEQAMTANTAAIIPVHLYGQVCALDRLSNLAGGRHAALIQDACQAHGVQFQGRPLTDYSSSVAYSFYPTKNLGCLGDGGAVATNDPAIMEHARLLRNGGRGEDQVCRTAGINSRLDEMQSCYLRAFLPHLEEWNGCRRRLAAIYDAHLKDLESVQPIERRAESVCHLYVIRARHRDALRQYLSRLGVRTGIHYPVPLHLQPAFQNCGLKPGDLPNAERACAEILSLPLWTYMPESMAERVAGAVRRFVHTHVEDDRLNSVHLS